MKFDFYYDGSVKYYAKDEEEAEDKRLDLIDAEKITPFEEFYVEFEEMGNFYNKPNYWWANVNGWCTLDANSEEEVGKLFVTAMKEFFKDEFEFDADVWGITY